MSVKCLLNVCLISLTFLSNFSLNSFKLLLNFSEVSLCYFGSLNLSHSNLSQVSFNVLSIWFGPPSISARKLLSNFSVLKCVNLNWSPVSSNYKDRTSRQYPNLEVSQNARQSYRGKEEACCRGLDVFDAHESRALGDLRRGL